MAKNSAWRITNIPAALRKANIKNKTYVSELGERYALAYAYLLNDDFDGAQRQLKWLFDKDIENPMIEQLNIEYLIKKGYVILEKNFRFEKHEIDIIAKHKQVLIVVEVKTRSTSKFGEPQNFVKPKQISRLVNAANAFMLKNNLDEEVRFDIVAIIKTQDSFKINHIENAFYYF